MSAPRLSTFVDALSQGAVSGVHIRRALEGYPPLADLAPRAELVEAVGAIIEAAGEIGAGSEFGSDVLEAAGLSAREIREVDTCDASQVGKRAAEQGAGRALRELGVALAPRLTLNLDDVLGDDVAGFAGAVGEALDDALVERRRAVWAAVLARVPEGSLAPDIGDEDDEGAAALLAATLAARADEEGAEPPVGTTPPQTGTEGQLSGDALGVVDNFRARWRAPLLPSALGVRSLPEGEPILLALDEGALDAVVVAPGKTFPAKAGAALSHLRGIVARQTRALSEAAEAAEAAKAAVAVLRKATRVALKIDEDADFTPEERALLGRLVREGK